MSYFKIQSPSQAESDQKDIIINQLRQDIEKLKSSTQQCMALHQTQVLMDSKFQQVEQDRLKSSQMYESRHKINAQQISTLKSKKEDLNSQQRKKQVEVFEIKGDNDTLQANANELTHQLHALKANLQENKDINTQLTGKKQSMEQEQEKLQEELKLANAILEQNQRKNDELVVYKNEKEQNLSQVGFQKTLLEKSLSQTISQNKALTLENQTRGVQKNYLEEQRTTGSQHLDELNTDIQELNKMFDQKKQECAKNLLQMKDEQQRGQDLNVRLQNLDALMKQRNMQVDDIRKENDRYRGENLELMNTNQQLSYDLESLKKHIDQLVERNSQFLTDFDIYIKEDEQLSILLNRKYRIHDIRVKAEDRIRQALMLVQADNVNRSIHS